MRSYLVKPAMYEMLIGGQQNALRTLARYQFSTWMDDIWDRSMYVKDTIDYWQGWQDLCFTIESDIEVDKRMKKDKAMIENGSHEAITLLNERFYRIDFSWGLLVKSCREMALFLGVKFGWLGEIWAKYWEFFGWVVVDKG